MMSLRKKSAFQKSQILKRTLTLDRNRKRERAFLAKWSKSSAQSMGK
ncbi:MAG: hypothetical protein IIB54_11080 [Planctomycetes bacterium]|nr:hypothetical protein [Planctomycetota bacterium]